MSTTTLRLDAPLKLRIANLAERAGRTPHSLMVEALEHKADEMEALHEFASLAAERDAALQGGQAGVDWHDMKARLRADVRARVKAQALGKPEKRVAKSSLA